jgi:hypothetical protein
MANQVQSKNIGVYLEVSGVYYPVFCGKSMRLSKSTEEIETTNITSGSERDYLPGMSSALMDVGGVTILDNTENRIAIGYLMQIQAAKTIANWKITKTDNDGDVLLYTFSGFIRESSFDKSQSPSYSQSAIQVRICGGYTVGAILPPGATEYLLLADDWGTVNGQNYIDGPSSGDYTGTIYTLLATDVVKAVDLEGTGFDIVQGTPTPGTRQCRFVTTPTVRIVFPADLIFDGSQRVYVLWERPL